MIYRDQQTNRPNLSHDLIVVFLNRKYKIKGKWFELDHVIMLGKHGSGWHMIHSKVRVRALEVLSIRLNGFREINA